MTCGAIYDNVIWSPAICNMNSGNHQLAVALDSLLNFIWVAINSKVDHGCWKTKGNMQWGAFASSLTRYDLKNKVMKRLQKLAICRRCWEWLKCSLCKESGHCCKNCSIQIINVTWEVPHFRSSNPPRCGRGKNLFLMPSVSQKNEP